MKILFYRYGSICEPFVLEALIKLGHEVVTIEDEILDKSITPSQCVNIVNGYLQKASYDIVFSINFYPALSEVCNIYKIYYVGWVVDSPVLELYSKSLMNTYNRIFMFDSGLYKEFVHKNPQGILYMPLGTDVEQMDKVIGTITDEDRRKYSGDVAFVGSTYEEKCAYNEAKNMPDYLKGYLEGIIESQLKVYGYNFIEETLTDDIVSEFKKYVDFYVPSLDTKENEKAVMAHWYVGMKVAEQERIRGLKMLSDNFDVHMYTNSSTSKMPNVINHGTASSDIEMPKIFNLSKINLNFTAKPIRCGLSLRVWDILGAGGFLLTNYQEEIPQFFEIGKDIETYGSFEELKEKVAYYLEHEDERKQIAINGYNKVKTYHTYEARLKEILKYV